MYEARQPIDAKRPTTDLQQGDIVANLLFPEQLTGISFNIKKSGGLGAASTPDIVSAGDDLQKIKLLNSVKRVGLSMVLSCTCDIYQATSPVLVAPIEPFEFYDDEDTDAKKWLRISADATGVGSTKLFYLTANETASIARSHAQLSRMVSLTHKYLTRCFFELSARRVLGLTPNAQRHLQYTLSSMFSRHAREDNEWPSKDDLRLKVAWLREVIPSAGRHKTRYEEELRKIEAVLSATDP